jgi:hypothetical protein
MLSKDFKEFIELLNENKVRLGYPPNRIDILTTLKDLKFEDCFKTKIEVEIQGLPIYFIDIENLKKQQNEFKKRLEAIMASSSNIGWGYHDMLCDDYYGAFPADD